MFSLIKNILIIIVVICVLVWICNSGLLDHTALSGFSNWVKRTF